MTANPTSIAPRASHLPIHPDNSLEKLWSQLRRPPTFYARVIAIQVLTNKTASGLLTPAAHRLLREQAERENGAAQVVLPARPVVGSGPSRQRHHGPGMAAAAAAKAAASSSSSAAKSVSLDCAWCLKDTSQKHYRCINGELSARRGVSRQPGDVVERICGICYCSIRNFVRQGSTKAEAVTITRRGAQVKSGIASPICMKCEAEIPKGAPKYRDINSRRVAVGGRGILDYVACLCAECFSKSKSSHPQQPF